MPTANPDPDFKDDPARLADRGPRVPLRRSACAGRRVYDNKVATPHRVEIRTIVTADDGNVVFSASDERRTEELKGVNGTYGHVATIPLKGVAPGRYVLRVEAQVARCRTAPTGVARGRVHRTLMGDVETIARGDDSRLVEPRRFVIRDRQAFAAVWAAHAGPDAAVPAVDFETRMVAAVFAGERPTPGFSRRSHRHAARGRGSRRCSLDERQPDPDAGGGAGRRLAFSHRHAAARRRRNSLQPSRSGRAAHDRLQASAAPRPSSTAAVAAASPVVGDRRRAMGASRLTGLTPRVAASLAYLAGPFSGALLLATETASRFVRFHAWQAVVGLGLLGSPPSSFLGLAFVLLIVSPTAFWAMLWLAAVTGAAWIGVWALCVVNAYKGRTLKLPLAALAERYAAVKPPS